VSQSRTVHGIFLFLGPVRKSFEHRSKKWWAAFIFLLGAALALVVGLIGLALAAGSHMGLQVVGGTALIAIAILAANVYRKWALLKRSLSRKQGLILLGGVSFGACVLTVPMSLVALPALWVGLSVDVILGGVTLAITLFVLFDAYPVLRDRGSPGMLTLAGLLIVLAITYMTAIAYWIVPYNPFTINVGPLLAPPMPGFPLGTTSLGQDLLSRTIAGGGTMLQVAFLSVAICFSIGVPIGLAASFQGGVVDRLVSLVMDSIYAFPGLILAIAIAAILGPGVMNMAIAIAVVYIPSYFRVIRSQVLTIKELPYVEATSAMGAKTSDKLLRYVLPNALPSALVVMSINFADAVLTAAGLTFVGLGLPIEVADWGWDLTFGSHQLFSGAWWVITFPGLMIVLLALGFTLIGEGLNEILTPKLED
jgi:peptide/nickel transport system permease protein